MTTFDRLMQDPKFKDEFEKGYNEFLISEFMIEKMEEENISVRELAKEAKVSPTTIQNLRSGNALDDLIADEFAEMRDLSKEDDSVTDFLDTGNYSLNYICSKSRRECW